MELTIGTAIGHCGNSRDRVGVDQIRLHPLDPRNAGSKCKISRNSYSQLGSAVGKRPVEVIQDLETGVVLSRSRPTKRKADK
jgi:hypothetical protein